MMWMYAIAVLDPSARMRWVIWIRNGDEIFPETIVGEDKKLRSFPLHNQTFPAIHKTPTVYA